MPVTPLDIRATDWVMRRLKRYRQNRYEHIAQRNWKKIFNGTNNFEHALEDDLKIVLYKESFLCRYIYEGFEKKEITVLKKILREGDTFIDAGSNIGLFSLYAAKAVGPSGKVIAFEPTPEIFNRLKNNCVLNHLTNIDAENIGLSDSNGFLKLHVSKNGRDGWNTFAKDSKGLFAETINVSVHTLDDYLAEMKIDLSKLRFIKIDVEGWEIPVIKGALKTINREGIVLMVEFTESNSIAAGYKISDLYDLVVAQGYTWCIYDEDCNCFRYDSKRSYYPYVNLFAVRNIEAINKQLSA